MRYQCAWLVVLIGILSLLVRLPGLGVFMTADEPNWMIRSADFYHQVFRHHHPLGTFMTTHPGATAMWLIGIGEFVQEARLGVDVDTSNLRAFRLAATLPIALATAALVSVVTWLAIRLLGFWPGLLGGVLLAVDPYLTGMSQVAHLDAVLALCMVGSVVSGLLYLKRSATGYVVLAGMLAGLAMGTKLLPALWLFAFWAGLLLWRWRWQWREIVRSFFFFGGIAVLTFYVMWPALWFGTDLDRSFKHDVATVVTDEHVVLEESDEPITPVTFYGRAVLGRTTPLVLFTAVGVLTITIFFVARYRRMPAVLALGLYALGFLVLMTIVAKKADRYALPALAVLPLLAGWGLAVALSRLRERWRLVVVTLGSAAVVLQLWLWMPYALAYNNPLFDVRPWPQQGWGEGLEAAATWFNAHPLGDRLTIASWYPAVTGTYFKGKTMSLSSRHDPRVGFVVLYRNMDGRARDTIASDVLDEFKNREPVYVVDIMGKPYVWIYETLGTHYFTKRAHEIIGTDEVGQIIPAAPAAWDHIELGMANYSGRVNTHEVILTIREQPDGLVVRQVATNARNIEDSWQRFRFEPIPDSAGKSYFVSLTSPTSVPGNAVTVRYIDKDILPGDMYQNGELKQGWDVAYRLTN